MLLEDGYRIEELLTERNQSSHGDACKAAIAFEGDLQTQDQQIADDLDAYPRTGPLGSAQLAIGQFKQAFTAFPEDFDPVVLVEDAHRFGGAQGLGQDEVGDFAISFASAKHQGYRTKGRTDGGGAIDRDLASGASEKRGCVCAEDP